jgi:predicted N-formylglutamate amidohydrolase
LSDAVGDSAEGSTALLARYEAPPFFVRNPGAGSPFVIIGDHAGCDVPARLAGLGLPPAELRRHIGWDIGVADLGTRLAGDLDGVFIGQRFSRLVIDCNRDPARADAVCGVSDGTTVPGNADLSQAARRARILEVFEPYHGRIAEALDARMAVGVRPILIALHSFTPVLGGEARPWRYGVLHLGDSAYADAVLGGLRGALGEAAVGDNQPYAMDGTDYSAPRHAAVRGLAYVELEVRQDLIGDEAGVAAAATLLAPILEAAHRR